MGIVWSKAQLARRRVPLAGKIRVGERTEEDGKIEFNTFDWFVGPNPLHEVYGPHPNEIEIELATDDIPEALRASYRRYGGKMGLICSGPGGDPDSPGVARLNGGYAQQNPGEYGLVKKTDEVFLHKASGETLTMETSGTFQYLPVPCSTACPLAMNGKCGPNIYFTFLVPKVTNLGYFMLSSQSFQTINNLEMQLEMAKSTTGGRLKGIPLKLKVAFRTASVSYVDKQGNRRTIQRDDIPEITIDWPVPMNQLEGYLKEYAENSLANRLSAMGVVIDSEQIDEHINDTPEHLATGDDNEKVAEAMVAKESPKVEEKAEPEAEEESEIKGEIEKKPEQESEKTGQITGEFEILTEAKESGTEWVAFDAKGLSGDVAGKTYRIGVASGTEGAALALELAIGAAVEVTGEVTGDKRDRIKAETIEKQ